MLCNDLALAARDLTPGAFNIVPVFFSRQIVMTITAAEMTG